MRDKQTGLCPLTLVYGAWIGIQGWFGGVDEVLFCL